jgi:hypothetical protein
LSRASTSSFVSRRKVVDGRDKPDKPGHDAESVSIPKTGISS